MAKMAKMTKMTVVKPLEFCDIIRFLAKIRLDTSAIALPHEYHRNLSQIMFSLRFLSGGTGACGED